MLGNDSTILGGLVAACTIVILNWAVDWISVRSTWFRHTFGQSPTLLVHDGAMVADNLRKEGLPEEFLWQALREHGIAEIERVQLAVLETDGSVSIIERGVVVKRSKKTHPATRKDG